jgi:prevent-host-death family protein
MPQGAPFGSALAFSPTLLYIIPYTFQDVPVARLRPTEDIRPLADFRANLASVVRQVQRTKRPVILTQHGKSAAVLVNAGEYEALVDRAELLEDVRAAEAEIEAGRGVAHGKAKAAVLARPRA